MEIILLKDIDTLGYKGDVINVKPGYARNYLLPNQIAVTATPSNRKRVQEEQRQATRKIEQKKEEAENLVKQLEATVISIPVKTGTSGKLFGSVTTAQIAQSLKREGFDIDRKKITLPESVKTIGTYKAQVKVYKDVDAEITVEVEGVQTEIGKKEDS